MQRMTGIDPMFIYSDTPETPMEIAYACLFDPSSLPGGYTFERVTAVLQTRIPTLQPFRRRLMPVPLGTGPPALGGRPGLRPVQPSAPGGAPGSGWRCRIPGQGGRGDGPPAHAGTAALGDARRRGDGRRHGRADRQGAPLGRRRRGRRRDAGQAARPDAGGQRRDRALPALDAGAAAVAGAADDRCPADLHPEPHQGIACRTRSRPHGGAPGPLRGGRPARPGVDPAGGARHVRVAGGRRPGGVLRRAEHGGGAGAEDPLRIDDQRRGARRLLRGAPLPSGGARPGRREPAGGRRARVGPRRQRTARRWATSSRPCSCRWPTTRRRRWSACGR